jgi:hypothetical protein
LLLTVVNVHVLESKDPPAGAMDQATSPVGVVFIPELLSMTVAVQLLAEPIRTDNGEQDTVVWVLRAVGVVPLTLALAPVPLFGVIEIVADFDPNVCGLKVTVNVAVPPPATSKEVGLTAKLPSDEETATLLPFEPLFVTVNMCELLDSPTPMDPKLKLVGLTERLGGSNCVDADSPDVSPVALTVYRPPIAAFRVNW